MHREEFLCEPKQLSSGQGSLLFSSKYKLKASIHNFLSRMLGTKCDIWGQKSASLLYNIHFISQKIAAECNAGGNKPSFST